MLNNGKIDEVQGMEMKAKIIIVITLLAFTLSGCFHAPFNNFHTDKRALRQASIFGGIGASAGAVVGSVVGNTAAGALIGAAAGTSIGLLKNTKRALLREIKRQDMELIEYGETLTLLIPTDRYFVFNSPYLNDICYRGLNNIVRLLHYYPNTTIYVAAFSDDVGSHHHKKMLTQARAEAMLTFLWANGISAQRLHPEGYADQHAIGDNKLIHGSAYNRRIELQWFKGRYKPLPQTPYLAAAH